MPNIKERKPLDQVFRSAFESIVHFRYTPVILCLLFILNGLFIISQNSGTCDELGAHIPSGYLYWKTGEFSGGIDNPPLGQLLITSLTKLFGIDYALFSEQNLFLFRLPVLIIGLLLGIFLYKFALLLYDKKAAILALLFYCFSPNILAHTSLATLDVQMAFFAFATIYYLFLYIKEQQITAYIAFCVFLALALVTKIQAVLLIPVAGIILIAYSKKLKRTLYLKSAVMYLILLIGIPLAIINLFYLNVPFIKGNGILPAEFISALKGKLLHGQAGHFSYMLGNYSLTGWWYYFPIVIFFKTPLSILLLFARGIARKPSKNTILFLILPIVVFLGASMRSNINIGIRHILIIYPFIFLLAAAGAVLLFSKTGSHKIKAFRFIFPVLILFYLYQAVTITPHQLSFFNILGGGSKNGHKILVDSNYDWGQNDYFLFRYIQNKGIKYKINPPAFEPVNGHILVNTNALYGVLSGGAEAYAWLKQYEPVNQIAYTWFEYQIPESDLPKLERFKKETPISQGSYASDTRAELESVQWQIAEIKEPEPHYNLAIRFANQSYFQQALAELRHILNLHPTDKRALYTGGEMIVRFKLGVLKFRDDDYLKLAYPGLESYSYIGEQTEPAEIPGTETKPVTQPEPGGISISSALFKDSVLTFILKGYQRTMENDKLSGKVKVTLTITGEDGQKRESSRLLTLEEEDAVISMRLRLPTDRRYSITIKVHDIRSGLEATATPQME
jgi:hypothetical protein